MRVKIFDVEHGACALITSPSGVHTLIDCGFNAITDFRPSTYLPIIGISTLHTLIISNYDEDHINDLIHLRKSVRIEHLIRNASISAYELKALKSANNTPSASLIELCKMIEQYKHPAKTSIMDGMEICTFRNRYPVEFQDTNNLSVVNFISCNGLRMVFAGDLETEGWKKLLLDEKFRNNLARVNVFVASHHGRENGYCDEVFQYCTPKIVVISDKNKIHGTQETTVKYASKVSGISLPDGNRKVFTTRNDGRIELISTEFGFYISTSKNPTHTKINLQSDVHAIV